MSDDLKLAEQTVDTAQTWVPILRASLISLAIRSTVAENKQLRAENERLRNEKVAGGPTGLERDARAGSVSSPASTTDPTSVCVWTLNNWTSKISWYERGCDGETYERWLGHLACPSCDKPIKFTEAKE